MLRRCSILLTIVVALGACGRRVDVPEWDPIDIDEFRSRFENPTASAAEVLVLGDKIFGGYEENLGVITATNRAVGRIRGLIDDPDAPPSEGVGDGDGTVSGTAVFLEISCAGPDPFRPVTDFSSGMLRIDGPRLSQDVIDRARIEGNLLFTFIACTDATVQLDGQARVYYDFEDEQAMVFEYELTATDSLLDEVVEVRLPAVYRPDRVAYLLEADSGKTFVFASDPIDPRTFELETADGVQDCDVLAQICTPR